MNRDPRNSRQTVFERISAGTSGWGETGGGQRKGRGRGGRVPASSAPCKNLWKTRKKSRTSCAAARSSKCLIQITLHRQAVCTKERDDSTFPEAVFLWFRTNWEKGWRLEWKHYWRLCVICIREKGRRCGSKFTYGCWHLPRSLLWIFSLKVAIVVVNVLSLHTTSQYARRRVSSRLWTYWTLNSAVSFDAGSFFLPCTISVWSRICTNLDEFFTNGRTECIKRIYHLSSYYGTTETVWSIRHCVTRDVTVVSCVYISFHMKWLLLVFIQKRLEYLLLLQSICYKKYDWV